MDNQHRSGRVCIRHGGDFQLLDDDKNAIEYLKKHLTTAIEIGDRAREGTAYGTLGNAYQLLGDYRKAI